MKILHSNILINDIVHNDLEYYIKSGYGGDHIKKWPFYKFIKMWVDGKSENARKLWAEWLVNEFNKYCLDVKSKGGMYQGSVHLYALKHINENKNKFWLNPSLIDEKYVRRGAEMLVNKRIEMIRSVKENGYQLSLADQIYAVKIGSKYVLKGGHHRAAILHVLGQNNLPGVIICSKILWEFKTWIFKIKKFIK